MWQFQSRCFPLVVWMFFILGGSALVSNAIEPDALQRVSAYNARDVGSPGWRRVDLELKTDGVVTRTFTVVNLWQHFGDEVRTLFFLEQPEGLRGTSYLLVEGGSEVPDMAVHLFLPAGQRRVLTIAPSHFDQGLLGSDFGYSDLRMRLSTRGYHYRIVGEAVLLDYPTWVVEVEPKTPTTRLNTSWGRAHLYIQKQFPFLLGADYYGKPVGKGDVKKPFKRMRVESLKQQNGVWTATRMVMETSDGRSSVLTLKGAQFSVADFEKDLFSPQSLPTLADRLREVWKQKRSKESQP